MAANVRELEPTDQLVAETRGTQKCRLVVPFNDSDLSSFRINELPLANVRHR
jgi:hypothetical protein